MALDYGIKEKTLKQRVRCELDGIPEALIPLNGNRDLDLPSGSR